MLFRSGVNKRNVCCGAPLAFQIENTDTRPRDYARLRDVPRPMHSDYAAAVRYHGFNDIRGGGQFSGRLTAPLCFAGAIAAGLLSERGIAVVSLLTSTQRPQPTRRTPARGAEILGGDKKKRLSAAPTPFPAS